MTVMKNAKVKIALPGVGLVLVLVLVGGTAG